MVINKMTFFGEERVGRKYASVPILDSLVSMLNDASPRRAPEIPKSSFQNALRLRFDKWIEGGKLDPFRKIEFELESVPLGHRVGNDGRVQFFLDCESVLSDPKPIGPEEEALVWLFVFQSIEGSGLLSRCSECKRYFLRERLPKGGQQPTRGDYCSDHKDKLRALNNKERRVRKTNDWIENAATFAREWNSKKRMKQWEWVEMKLNRKGIWVKKKWITEHKEDIQNAMAELDASDGK